MATRKIAGNPCNFWRRFVQKGIIGTQRHNIVSVSNDKYYSRSSPILIKSEFHRRSPSSQDSIETPPLSSYSSQSSQSLIGGIPLGSSARSQSQSLIGGIPYANSALVQIHPSMRECKFHRVLIKTLWNRMPATGRRQKRSRALQQTTKEHPKGKERPQQAPANQRHRRRPRGHPGETTWRGHRSKHSRGPKCKILSPPSGEDDRRGQGAPRSEVAKTYRAKATLSTSPTLHRTGQEDTT